MIQIKDTARLAGLVPQMVLALVVAEGVYADYGAGLCITSANDSVHSGRPVAGEARDPHYTGKAVDVRIHQVSGNKRAELVAALEAQLGPEFFVLWESQGLENEHVHIQYGHPSPETDPHAP